MRGLNFHFIFYLYLGLAIKVCHPMGNRSRDESLLSDSSSLNDHGEQCEGGQGFEFRFPQRHQTERKAIASSNVEAVKFSLSEGVQ